MWYLSSDLYFKCVFVLISLVLDFYSKSTAACCPSRQIVQWLIHGAGALCSESVFLSLSHVISDF